MILDDIVSRLEELAGEQHQTLVLYSALWPWMRIVNMPVSTLASELCARINDRFYGRTLLMPTFTRGFDSLGVCDLDSLPSQTGVLSEFFRISPGVRRTRSAFFSFAVSGPKMTELISLNPSEAWGSGSLYEWLYLHDAAILTMGLHPTHCSYTHYAEWLHRRDIPYRFKKTFSCTLLHERISSMYSETLSVRRRDPEPINDFTWLLPIYLKSGMQVSQPHEFTISCMGAHTKMDEVLSALKRDPLALICNKKDFIKNVN